MDCIQQSEKEMNNQLKIINEIDQNIILSCRIKENVKNIFDT
jgi:hypothetical protein